MIILSVFVKHTSPPPSYPICFASLSQSFGNMNQKPNCFCLFFNTIFTKFSLTHGWLYRCEGPSPTIFDSLKHRKSWNKLPKSTVSSRQQECIGDTVRKQGIGLGEAILGVMGVLRDGKKEWLKISMYVYAQGTRRQKL